MKLSYYADGMPSREIETNEEDLEAKSIVDIRDDLNNLQDLIAVCVESLMHSPRTDIKTLVGHVLYFNLQNQIRSIDEELKAHESN